MGWLETLAEQLHRTGQGAEVLEAASGRLLLTAGGARILGCELAGVDENLFFHTDRTPGGRLAGGDRLWLAPELGFFWPSVADALRDPQGTASVPPAIDPGGYQLSVAGTGRWEGSAALQDVRDSRRIDVQVKREVAWIDPPQGLPADLVSLSFSLSHELTVAGGDPGAVAGAWSILQVPPTGTLICPVAGAVAIEQVRSYYGAFGARHVQVGGGAVRFLIDGARWIKMGLRPEQTTGRMGFVRVLPDGRWALILRFFPTLPGACYVDLPRDTPGHPSVGGDVLQAYNDAGDAFPGTTFGEMEYHDPAVRVGAEERRTGTSVTHVLVGEARSVAQAGQTLLGVPIEPLQ